MEKLAKDKHFNLLRKFVNYEQKSFITLCRSGRFYKHVAHVTYSPIKKAAPSLQNARAYLATVVNYAPKMFMKSTPGPNVIKLFFVRELRIFILS